MTKRSVITKVLSGLIIGAIGGAVTGDLILGGLGWFSEGSLGSGDESRWAFLGLYLGARLGLLLGFHSRSAHWLALDFVFLSSPTLRTAVEFPTGIPVRQIPIVPTTLRSDQRNSTIKA